MAEANVTVGLRGIVKRFDHVTANDGVDLDLRAGEVHALLGENGAGKSTLMNVLSGVYLPDEGSILMHGRDVRLGSPEEAARAGIGMVHQHFRLIDRFTVAENVHLGWEQTPRRLHAALLERRTAELADRWGLTVDPAARVVHLSVGEQQRVEILRTLVREPEVLILDEPTAVLAPDEVRDLFAVVRRLRDTGTAVVLIAHKIDEVLEIADRVTVMRGGRRVVTLPCDRCDRDTLVRHMLGGDVPSGTVVRPLTPGRTVLAAEGVSVAGDRGTPALADVSLEIREHEIVGVAGVAGNGQRELSEVLTGLRRVDSGRVAVDGRDLSSGGARAFIRAGVGHIPEDRRSTGLVLGQPIWASAILKAYRSPPLRCGPLLGRRRVRRFATELADSARVSIPTLDTPVDHLSGGNAQRLLAARESRSATRAIVAVHPSRGLDVAAIEDVRDALLAARESGLGILLISEDLDEVLAMSDRVVVMSGGRLVGAFERAEAERERIGYLMSGLTEGGPG